MNATVYNASLAAGTIAVHERAVMAAGARFELHFKGHAGHVDNERADGLANRGVELALSTK